MYTEVGSRLKALEFFQLWRFCLSTMRIKKLLKTIIYKLNTVKLLIFKGLKGHLPRLQSQVMAEMRNSTRWMQIRIRPEGWSIKSAGWDNRELHYPDNNE